MSSSAPYGHSAASSIPHRPAAYRPPVTAPNAPPGTFAPGTKVQVGNHRVMIEKYLSEGGFAHVYLVRVPGSPETAVLKRVAVPDKDALANMRTEVETMKKLKGHKHIVTYMDSHASQLKGGGYEVFLLMEYCSGGGLIDFMNTRLQHRLTEPEILHIFSDVAEGVATMHYLKPPLLHRDLKVENVLITTVGGSTVYKLCDFGSTAPPRPAATSAAEGRLIEDDVQRHTTLQYRSPEMIDVYRKQPIDEKSDIWALGVLLYKLCYYTTPFEEQGQMAILNASYKFPPYPQFSDRLKKLIASMLRENPKLRPNIYQVVVEVCSMRHRSVPIKDIYSNRTASEARRNEQLPSPEPHVASPPIIGLQKVAPVQQVQMIPEITPMRRGRPTGPAQQPPAVRPSPSPMRGSAADPFAALDSQNLEVRSAAADELASRFPSLDEFSLLHDRGAKFQFGQTQISEPKQETLNKKITQALADDAFALPSATKAEPPPIAKPSTTASNVSRTASIKKSKPYEVATDSARQSSPATIHQPSPQRPGMVSTGIQTSPSPSPAPPKFDVNNRPVWRVPSPKHHHRALSQPRASDTRPPTPSSLRSDFLPPRPSLLDSHRSKSQTATLTIPKSPASSRPSLESSRPSALDLGDALGRSKSALSRPRPTSVHVESNLDYLRDRESSARSFHPPDTTIAPTSANPIDSDSDTDETNIRSNVEFLRSMESDEAQQKKSHRRSGSSGQFKHSKRSSLPSLSLSNTKNIVKGKFGDAFRRFETNSASSHDDPTTPPDHLIDRSSKHLTPIAGSVATGDASDDERVIDETEDLPPEVRREIERRRLSQEEKRVADAAAEYRKRLAEQGDGGKGKAGPTRASTIQNRVKELLDTKQQVSTSRTAEGYGKYTDERKALPPRPDELPKPPLVARKPVLNTVSGGQVPSRLSHSQSLHSTSSSAPAAAYRASPGSSSGRPSAPPKPKALRTGGGQVESLAARPSVSRDKPLPVPGNEAETGDDWDMASFSKRYPSLSGLEMVETEIGYASGKTPGSRTTVRDV